MNPTDIPTLDAETVEAMKKIEIEAKNNEAFFTQRTYLDTGETVGDNPFWMLKLVEDDSPIDREEGYTYYYAIKNLEDIPTEKLSDDEIDTIELNRAEVDETGEARFKITEMHEFDNLDGLFAFCHEGDDE